ncbi:MAG: DUF4019 domain-containing protein [Alphaproteobacteria bacterium]|nr:DUF4019 domain-containing protein [Alphaproteobacteria bacterium]
MPVARVIFPSAVIPIIAMIFAMTPLSAQERGIGYASPSDALVALRSREGVVFSDYNGWTIAEDAGRGEIWSFTPPNHPAHPAVVRRTVIEQNGTLSIDMQALCGADKQTCDSLVAEFRKLNEQLRAELSGQQAANPGAQAPRPGQAPEAEAVKTRFVTAIDQERLDDAYAMFSERFRREVTRDQFETVQKRQQAGLPERGPVRTTWYRDPPNAPEAGTYVVFEQVCRLPDGRGCLDMIVLHQAPGAAFVVQRYERTFISRADR